MTKTEAFNLSLDTVGSANVASPTDGSREANICSKWWPIVKDSVLEELPWEFAERSQSLALVSGSADTPYSDEFIFAYAYPADCLVANNILNTGSDLAKDQIPFKRQTNATLDVVYILTNEEDAVLLYTAATESFTTMRSSHLRLALVYKLGAQIATPLKKDTALRDKNLDSYFSYMALAKTKDANESQPTVSGEFKRYQRAATT
jgi:hypothetical protein